MANIPLKWGKVGTDGKAEVNGADNTTFGSSSPAFKVNGDEEITGNSSVGGGQSITGDLSVGGDLAVTGDETVTGNLEVTGDENISGNETINGNLIVNKDNITNKVGINVANPDRPLDIKGTNGIKCQPGSGVSYIDGCAGNGTGLYIPKDTLGVDHYIPAVTVQTKSGGAWSMGNYNNDQLQFSFGTKANIDSKTNTVNTYSLNTDGTFSGRSVKLKDKTNNNDTFLDYGNSAVSWGNTTYLGAWDGYTLRAMNKNQLTRSNLGLGSAADYNADTANSANTVVRRDGNGDIRVRYAYTTHVNQSSSDQTTTYDSTSGFVMYANTDGWLRKAKVVTSLYSGSLAPYAKCSWANYKAYDFYIISATVDGGNVRAEIVVPRNLLPTSMGNSSVYGFWNESHWAVFYMWYSGTTGYCYVGDVSNDNARIKNIYGVV